VSGLTDKLPNIVVSSKYFQSTGKGDRQMAYERDGIPTALEGGAMLHRLALSYWADGRLADALRVDLQAATLVRYLRPRPRLLVDIRSTIEALTRELGARH
jgi:hypothetical protein